MLCKSAMHVPWVFRTEWYNKCMQMNDANSPSKSFMSYYIYMYAMDCMRRVSLSVESQFPQFAFLLSCQQLAICHLSYILTNVKCNHFHTRHLHMTEYSSHLYSLGYQCWKMRIWIRTWYEDLQRFKEIYFYQHHFLQNMNLYHKISSWLYSYV